MKGRTVARVQLALNVADLESAIDFYTRLLGTGPAKVKPGYANFAVVDPPLKLVLIEGGGAPGSINHLGVEVATTDEVTGAITRLDAQGLATEIEAQTTCCYAVQDKVWVTGPDDERWEVYCVTADADTFSATPSVDGSPCCGERAVALVSVTTTVDQAAPCC